MIDTVEKPVSAEVLPSPGPRRSRAKKALRLIKHCLATIGFCFIFYHLCFEVTVMTSSSMAPTLRGSSNDDGDRILVEKITGRFRRPRRWEIYFFYNTDGIPVAKRVIGLPG